MKPSSKLTTPKTQTKLNFRKKKKKNPATHAYLIEKRDNFVKGT